MHLFKSQGLEEPNRVRVASYRAPAFGPHYGHHAAPPASSGPTATTDEDDLASLVAHERALLRALARYDRA